MIAKIQRKIWPENRMSPVRRYLAVAYSKLWRLYTRRVFGETMWISLDRARILVRTEDFRAYRIARMGGTQKKKIQLWREMALLAPEVCVDVGANYGEFVAAIADLGLPTIAIEANHMLASCLKESFAKHDNVTVILAVASDSEGESPFFFNPRSTGSGSLSSKVPNNQITSSSWGGEVKEMNVSSRKLDNLIPQVLSRLPQSVIMKVDVEGFEESVFRGATSLLEKAVWWRALVEFNPTAIQHSGGDPNRAWNMLRVFPGVIIATNANGPEPFHLSSILPVTPPSFCDVIIGQGMAPNTEQGIGLESPF